MNQKLLDALENCLQGLEQGEGLDSVLRRYPDLAEQLRPLLETAALARSAASEDLPAEALGRQRAHGLALAADLRQRKNRNPMRRHSWRPALTALSVIALLVMSSNGLLIASAHSIPGDTLYPLKRSVESTQLRLAFSPAQRQALEQTFDERRLDETRSLLTRQRVEKVDFTGVLSSRADNDWVVAGIRVIVSASTDVDDGIGIGDAVEVLGATNSAGDVDATRLSLVTNPAASQEHPHVMPTPTPTLVDSGLQKTPDESSFNPNPSGEDGNQAGEGDDQSSARPVENAAARENAHASQAHSEAHAEQQASSHE